MFRKLIHEPLVHFFLGGAFLYLLYTLLNPQDAPSPTATKKKILIHPASATKILDANSSFNLQAYKQILQNEAYFLELYKDDKQVNDILVRKMEFILQHQNSEKEPSETKLRDFYKHHKQNYLIPTSLSLYLLDVSSLNAAQQKELKARLNLLNLTPKSAKLLQNVSPKKLKQEYGRFFYHSMRFAPLHRWSGPFTAKDNRVFLLYMQNKKGKEYAPFSDVESLVYKEYKASKVLKAKKENFDKIKQHYQIEKR